MWEELKATDFYFKLDAAAHAIDSLLMRQKDFRKYLSNKPIAVSVHVSGARDYNYLLSIQLETESNEAEVIEGMNTLFRATGEATTRMYDGVEIYTIMPG